MKRIILSLSIAAAAGAGLTGCSDYLDSDYLFDERMTIEDVFTNSDYTNRWLARCYYWLSTDQLQDVCSKTEIPFNFADDMYYGDTNIFQYADWKNGEYSESGIGDNSREIWQNAYKGIRQVAIFLNNIDMNQELTAEEISDMKGQVRFLRAYFYWILLRTYGPIPIVPDEGIDYTDDYDKIAQPRNTYDECANYIAEEAREAAALLPLTRDPRHAVRPTRGAALALRAKVLLFAASPMFNGGAPAEVQAQMVTREGEPLLSSTYDERKWALAAAAAKDVMNLGVYELYHAGIRTSGRISYPATLPPQDDPISQFDEKDWPDGYRNIDPFESYRSIFNGDLTAETDNKELIFTRGQNQGGYGINIMAIHQLPRREGKGYNCHGMTLKQSDAYYMADGSDCPGMNEMYVGWSGYSDPLRVNTAQPKHLTEIITEDEAANYPELGPNAAGVCKQFAGREPRFYASVAYNGCTWNLQNGEDAKDEVRDVQVFYYSGLPNGYQNSTYWLRTGIGIKKYIHPNDISNTQQTSNDVSRMQKKVDPAIRYAEILLIYAEAINELSNGSYDVPSWDGSTTYTLRRDINELKKGIQPIRIRAGIPDYPGEIYDDPDKFRIKLKRERQIELFAEGHRYFDLRRWCDADDEESAPIYGYNVYCTQYQAELFHTPVEVPDMPSIFTTKMWFWPLHYDLLKRNKELSQNPGWTDAE